MSAVGLTPQVRAVLGVFLGDWPLRISALVVPVVGAAGATFILVSILAIANGISDAMKRAGSDDIAVVLHRDTQVEMASRLSDDDVAAIMSSLNALHPSDTPRLVSPELVQTVDTVSRGGEAGAQVLARGISTSGIRLRKQFRIVQGRPFTPGKLEVIVGRRLAREFSGLALGTTLTGSTHEWSIVGVFADGGGTGESEVWMDLDSARTESGARAPISSLRVQLLGQSDIDVLRAADRSSPQLQAQIAVEREYQSRVFSQAIERIRWLAMGLALLLGVGAVVASVNTMSAAIVARERSVATLLAIGFEPSAAAMAAFTEAVMLGLIGGACGAAAAFFVADGYGIAVLNGVTKTPFALSAAVTAASLAQGIALAAMLSAIAAIAPSVSLARRGPRVSQ